MTDQKIALIVDTDWTKSGPVAPNTLQTRIDALRRQLEERINLKQLGPGLFGFYSAQKEDAFEAVDRLEDWISHNCLRATFIEISSLEEDFESWKIDYDERMRTLYEKGGGLLQKATLNKQADRPIKA